MYPPKIFQQNDLDVLHDFITETGFCILVSSTDVAPEATHLPILLDKSRGDYGVLRGHFAHSNPHIDMLNEGDRVRAIFTGPHAYVSPELYPSKVSEPRVAPTTNYVAVHAVGSIRIYRDTATLTTLLHDMTEHFERRSGNDWRVDDLPNGFLEKVVRKIVGFEIEVKDLSGRWKLSQERPKEDRTNIMNILSEAEDYGTREVAQLMKE